MINSKRTIAQEVIRLESGGDQSKDSQLDPREVMIKVVHVLNDRIKKNFFTNYAIEGGSDVDGQYIASFPSIAVSYDVLRDEYYSALPNIYVALPRNRGIMQISPMKNQCDGIFIIRSNGSKGIFATLPAANLQQHIGVYPEGNKVYYDSLINKKGITKVLMKLVAGGPENIADTDPLPLDSAEIASIIQDVRAMFQAVQPQDKLNNNNKQM